MSERRVLYATNDDETRGRRSRLFQLLWPIHVPGGLVCGNPVVVVAVLSGTVGRARDEVRVLNAPGDSTQPLLASA